MPKFELYRVVEAAGYGRQGLAGFSTTAADQISVEKDESGRDTGFRRPTDKGMERLAEVRRALGDV